MPLLLPHCRSDARDGPEVLIGWKLSALRPALGPTACFFHVMPPSIGDLRNMAWLVLPAVGVLELELTMVH